MNGRLRVITAPAVEPVTADEIKLAGRISGTTEDTLIETWISAARERAEAYQGRAYITQTLELSLDDWPTVIRLPRSPIVSVTSVKYYDTDETEATLAASRYYLDTDAEPARITLAHGETWPSTTLRYINGIKVRYVAGYGGDATTTPAAVKEAIMLYVIHRYENRVQENAFPDGFYHLLDSDRVYL